MYFLSGQSSLFPHCCDENILIDCNQQKMGENQMLCLCPFQYFNQWWRCGKYGWDGLWCICNIQVEDLVVKMHFMNMDCVPTHSSTHHTHVLLFRAKHRSLLETCKLRTQRKELSLVIIPYAPPARDLEFYICIYLIKKNINVLLLILHQIIVTLYIN